MADKLIPFPDRLDEKRRWQQRSVEIEIFQMSEQIEELCMRACQAHISMKEHHTRNQNSKEEHPEFAYADILKTIIHILVFLIPFGVYFFNLVLIYEPASYLAGRFLGRDFWLTHLVTFLIPSVLLVFELGLACLKSLAQREKLDPRFWSIACHVIVWITPLLVLAAHCARFSAESRWPEWHELMIVTVLFGLALLTDVVVIHGNFAISQSLGFSWYHLQQTRRNWQKRRAFREFCACAGEADKLVRRCKRLVADFNSRFPNATLELPSLSNTTQLVLEIWVGYTDPTTY